MGGLALNTNTKPRTAATTDHAAIEAAAQTQHNCQQLICFSQQELTAMKGLCGVDIGTEMYNRFC